MPQTTTDLRPHTFLEEIRFILNVCTGDVLFVLYVISKSNCVCKSYGNGSREFQINDAGLFLRKCVTVSINV